MHDYLKFSVIRWLIAIVIGVMFLKVHFKKHLVDVCISLITYMKVSPLLLVIIITYYNIIIINIVIHSFCPSG